MRIKDKSSNIIALLSSLFANSECKIIVNSQEPLVWAVPDGMEVGLALTPLYPSVPLAASADPQLYELLGLVDALRVGRVRERQLAAIALQERLEGGNERS